MPETITVNLPPPEAADPAVVRDALCRAAGRRLARDRIIITRRSIDARKKRIVVNITAQLYDDSETVCADGPDFVYQDVSAASPVIVVGSGPAGLFAALKLLELGLKPIVLERGKPVDKRLRDVAALNRRGILDEESNYAFGEGGAGTFSDGKLYTRSKKRGDHRKVLHCLHQHGANERVLVDAHPHIGSNRLPTIVAAMRQSIRFHGGEIHFENKVVDLLLRGGRVTGVKLADGQHIDAAAVILATGHSARDVFAMLVRRKIALEAKPFAMGVRVEHPQRLIDRIQYHGQPRGNYLPAATYRLAQQADGRGVYSFCMCPGGIIVPAATDANTIVVNGMSFAKRNSPFANAGIVVEIQPGDPTDTDPVGPLTGLDYQRRLERLAHDHGGGGMVAPAQRLTDFVHDRRSADLPPCSYPPGVVASPLHEWLYAPLRRRLQSAFRAMDRKMKGFLSDDALIVGVESRTSSPVRIPRCPRTLQHVSVKGLFPCGEGAGYAGGIVSCAVDGERVAEAVARYRVD